MLTINKNHLSIALEFSWINFLKFKYRKMLWPAQNLELSAPIQPLTNNIVDIEKDK